MLTFIFLAFVAMFAAAGVFISLEAKRSVGMASANSAGGSSKRAANRASSDND